MATFFAHSKLFVCPVGICSDRIMKRGGAPDGIGDDKDSGPAQEHDSREGLLIKTEV